MNSHSSKITKSVLLPRGVTAAPVAPPAAPEDPASGRRHFFLCSRSWVGTIISLSSHTSFGSSLHSWYLMFWHLVETAGRQLVVCLTWNQRRCCCSNASRGFCPSTLYSSGPYQVFIFNVNQIMISNNIFILKSGYVSKNIQM